MDDAFSRTVKKILLFFCIIVELQTTLGKSSSDNEEHETKKHDHCIIGAGPGGLQIANFMHKASRNYIVFERNNVAGSFYEKYPRHRKLISINKRFTGETNSKFNMRHDWNSLLSDDPSLLFRHYSSDYYPSADAMTKYLQDYARKLKLNIQYNTEIYNISSYKEGKDNMFKMEEKKTKIKHTCRTVILATGLSRPHKPSFIGSEHVIGYEDVSTNASDFTGKSVLILGKGNAAFETAESMFGETNLIHMISQNRVRLSWSTHYVGDLRGINNAFLDNYQLKSLDGILESPVETLNFVKNENGKIYLSEEDIYKANCSDKKNSAFKDNTPMRTKYDFIIRCLGFSSDMSLFHSSTRPSTVIGGKYPILKEHYESANIPGLYIAGALSHQLDYRKSAGGFIHGFRYTARALFKIIEQHYHDKKWESKTFHFKDFLNRVIKRVNEADGLYQMFSVLGDVFIIDKMRETVDHYEEFPIKSLKQFVSLTGEKVGNSSVLVLCFQYGQNFSGPGKDTFGNKRAVGAPELAHQSNFLHPVFYYYETLPESSAIDKYTELPLPTFLHHIVEDFLTDFTAKVSHITPLRRFIEHIIQLDIRTFNSDFCLTEMFSSQSLPPHCHPQALGNPTNFINF